MSNIIKYGDNRIIGLFYKDSTTLHSVYTQRTSTSVMYPYGTYLSWFGTEWLIGGGTTNDSPVPGLSGAYSYNVVNGVNYTSGVDQLYFPNQVYQLAVEGGKSLMYIDFESTNSTNLGLYITGLCKANTNTNLTLSYAYSVDGTNNFTTLVGYGTSYSLTTDWTPFVLTTNLFFGIVPSVRIVPVVWSGSYLYGPTIKDLTVMLLSDQHNG